MKPHYLFDTNVVVLTLFPGIQESIINSVLHVPGLKAVVLKTFGSGNAPVSYTHLTLPTTPYV